MGTIHESLVLQDQFSSTFGAYIRSAQKAAGSTSAAQQQLRSYQSALRSSELASVKANAAFEASSQRLDALRASGEEGTSAYRSLETQNERLRLRMEQLNAQTESLAQKAAGAQTAVEQEAEAIREQSAAAESAAKSTDKLADSQKMAETTAKALTSSIRRMAASYLSIQGLKKAVDLSDTLVSSRARLDQVVTQFNQLNGSMQTTQELETMIYQSAQRSRGNFTDTMGLVSQLGTMAGGAFNSTKEIVQFAEQLNKQLALSGTSGASAQAAILQLEQGLASGVLRGDELNSVMEQAPAIAKAIAGYLDVDIGQLRTLGAEGKITASIVKNALFDAAKDTNEAFSHTPMTWAQVWTVATNAAIRAMDPLLSAINWVANNIQTVIPVVISLGAAFGILLIAANWTNILNFATQKMAAAQAFLNAVMAANPAALAAAGILILVAALYAGVAVMNHFAGTSVSATGIITGAFAVMGAFVFNGVLVPLQNGFASFANFVGNVFTNPVAAVKVLFYDMALTVLQYMQNIAQAVEGLVNMIPGVQVDLTSGLNDWITDLAKKRSDEIQNSGYIEYVKPWENMDLGSAYTKGYDWGANLSLDGLFGSMNTGLDIPQAADVNDLLKNIDKNTGKIAKTVDLSDEQLKMMVDIAERKFVNNINLTSQAPVITVQGQNTGDTEADRQSLAEMLGDLIFERVQSGSVVPVR